MFDGSHGLKVCVGEMCGGMTLTSTVSYGSNGQQQLDGKVGDAIAAYLWTSVMFLDYVFC